MLQHTNWSSASNMDMTASIKSRAGTRDSTLSIAERALLLMSSTLHSGVGPLLIVASEIKSETRLPNLDSAMSSEEANDFAACPTNVIMACARRLHRIIGEIELSSDLLAVLVSNSRERCQDTYRASSSRVGWSEPAPIARFARRSASRNISTNAYSLISISQRKWDEEGYLQQFEAGGSNGESGRLAVIEQFERLRGSGA